MVDASSRPVRSLVIGAMVAGIEGVALIGYAVYIVVQVARLGITGPAEVSSPIAVTLEILIFGLLGVAMVLAARGLWYARRWARSLLVVGQFLALVVGIPLAMAEGDVERAAGVGLVALAIAGILAAFWPTTTAAVADS